jgi:hypothetical protein
MKHLSCLLLILPWMAACSPPATNPNRILAENELPGTTEWLIDVPYDTCSLPDHRFCRRPQVEGYCSQTSYQAGDTVDLFVSTEPGAQYTIDIYRMGYYQGKGGHLKKSTGPLPGKSQPTPEPDPKTNFAECKWEARLATGCLLRMNGQAACICVSSLPCPPVINLISFL